MSPRFTVGTVTGWPIGKLIGRTRAKPSTIAYVYDSAYCYRPVAMFPSHARYGPGHDVTPEQAARALADQLNREYA